VKTTEIFISEARTVHGTKFEYKRSIYKGARSNITITCREHGDFEQIASNHLRGAGCKTCSGGVAIDTRQWIKRAKIAHGKKYNYDKSIYLDAKTEVSIKCKQHGDFFQIARNHLAGQGCPKCGNIQKTIKKTSTAEQFTARAMKLHNMYYSYSDVVYIKQEIPVNITCPLHGVFKQTPSHHLRGCGCPACGNEFNRNNSRKFTTDSYIDEAMRVHGTKYLYDKCEYKGQSRRVTLICEVHGEFTSGPFAHLNGQGCPKCRSYKYSRIAIEWLEAYTCSKKLKNMQHANAGGEFRIPGTRYHVDGYHAASNTVFEFYGDAIHGNPKIYKRNEHCHPFNRSITAGELHKRTMVREREIKKLGYTVVSIWENDYRNSFLHK
jgi:Zn finger protein HypA/HybF involved in hydrogenase expression